MLAERELGKEDFGYALELTFRPEGSTDSLYPTPPHKLKHPFKFKDYMPKVRVVRSTPDRRQHDSSSLSLSLSLCVCVCVQVFRAIRGLSKIEEDDYMISVAGMLCEG